MAEPGCGNTEGNTQTTNESTANEAQVGVNEAQSTPVSSSSTKKRFLDSLKKIATALDQDDCDLDDFAIELSHRFRKQGRTTTPKSNNKCKKRKGPKTAVYKCRLTCLADCTSTSVKNLHKILPCLNSSGLGVAPHERSSHTSPNRQSSSLPLIWNEERFEAFILDTFPAIDVGGSRKYDLMFADANKTLHLIPPDVNTPEKLKSYATGRSAIYIRPKHTISLAGSSSEVSGSVSKSSESASDNNQLPFVEIPTPVVPQSTSAIAATVESGSTSQMCVICTKPLVTNDDVDLGQAVPCGHVFHFTCIDQWYMHTEIYLSDVTDICVEECVTVCPTKKPKCPECSLEIDSVNKVNNPNYVDLTENPSLPPDDADLTSFSEAMIQPAGGTSLVSRLEPPSTSILEDCDVFVPNSLLKLRSTLKDKRILTLSRQTLVDDLLNAYEDPTLAESDIEVVLLNEDAVDFGGVTRDVFCAFWDQILNDINMFSGEDCKLPLFNASNATSAMRKLPIIGRILSHSYLVTGCFPNALSLCGVISMFLGNTVQIDDEILIGCLFDYLPRPESDFIKKALTLSHFDESVMDRIVDIYTANGLTRLPKPDTFRQDIIFLATFILRLQPTICFTTITSGLPECQKLAWCSLNVDDFVKIYEDQRLSPGKVINAITPDSLILTPQQDRVLYFLKTLIRELSPYCLKNLVRFVTGSSNLLVSHLYVTFHNANQMPKAMTCSQTLILSTYYSNYCSFKHDFTSLLQNEEAFLMLCA